MKHFGLIGFPLGHSFSKSYFENKFKIAGLKNHFYNNYPIRDLTGIRNLILSEGLTGFNVTIPYKTEILQYVDHISAEAEVIGAANTILIEKDQFYAFNTDYLGFKNSLEEIPFEKGKKALILGYGGAAKAIAYTLDQLSIDFIIVSRNPGNKQISYEFIDEKLLADTSLIINTSPLGMSPNKLSFPNIPYKHLNSNHFCYDLVYNPEETEFLRKASIQGAGIKNGLEMLILQAEESWKIWNKVK